ncbi:MAG: DUF4091 domain-containing protein [Clostridia bacterium]|nr:DUF4091 domain-containing protein [Clostridia bacterium]
MLRFVRNSAYDVFKSTREKMSDTTRLCLHSAKNAFAAGQLVLREHSDFEITGVRFVNFSAPYVLCEDDVRYYYQDFVRYNDGEYPDKLSDAETVKVGAECSQSIWIIADVKAEALAGLCTFDAVVATSVGEFAFPCSVRVYNVTVPDADKAEFYLEYFLDPFTRLAGDRWGGDRMKFLYSYAESLKMIRNNSIDVIVIPLLLDGGSKRVSETEWALDFTYVEKYVDFMMKNVPTKRFAVRSIIASVNGDVLPMIGYGGKTVNVKYKTPEAEAWMYAYFNGIYKFFEKKGLLDMLQFRLQDEPHYTDCWIWARQICAKAAPGIKCGEPLDEHPSGLGLQGYIDTYIPRINVYEPGADYYDRMRAEGKEVWVYSCCFPEEAWWINKFIDHPHNHSRIMSWACYKRKIQGFLHWGYNYWSETSLYGTSPSARFKGDGFIVYPDKENLRVTPSTRLIATAEGIIEFELFKIVEQKDPAEAAAICASVTRTFTDYDDDPEKIESAHIRLLQAAEEAAAR